jgi:2-polyprenyl-3-methyl-5-hydroxy-6-metoxy-1,4-benzoquinol methylase
MDWDANEHYKEQSVAVGYDAARFSSIPGRVFNTWEQRVIAKCFASVPKGATVVDMPCGTGRLAEPLLTLGFRVHGMDISAEMLAVAKQRLKRFGDRFTSEVADAQKIQQNRVEYDGALCARVLMHFPLEQQIEFLTGVGRLSKGVVVINHSFDSPYQRFRRGIKRMLGHQASARSPISNADIKKLLAGAGLREVKRYRLWSLISEAVYIVARKA